MSHQRVRRNGSPTPATSLAGGGAVAAGGGAGASSRLQPMRATVPFQLKQQQQQQQQHGGPAAAGLRALTVLLSRASAARGQRYSGGQGPAPSALAGARQELPGKEEPQLPRLQS